MSTTYHSSYTDDVTEFKAADMNAPLKQLDLAIKALAQIAVKDKDLTSPPGSPADGDAYIVGASATGDWSGQDNKIAYYDADATAWKFATPAEGWRAWVQDEDKSYRYDGSAWSLVELYIIGAVQCLPHGAWIARSGRIWDPLKVRKNRGENRFESTTSVG